LISKIFLLNILYYHVIIIWHVLSLILIIIFFRVILAIHEIRFLS
jgi:hypothetical protein